MAVTLSTAATASLGIHLVRSSGVVDSAPTRAPLSRVSSTRPPGIDTSRPDVLAPAR